MVHDHSDHPHDPIFQYSVSVFGVIVSSIITFVLSSLWYGPLFGKLWIKNSPWTEEDMKKRARNIGTKMIFALVIQLITNYTFAVILQTLKVESYCCVICAGTFLSLGLIASQLYNAVLWEGQKPIFYGINALNRWAVVVVGGCTYYSLT